MKNQKLLVVAVLRKKIQFAKLAKYQIYLHVLGLIFISIIRYSEDLFTNRFLSDMIEGEGDG
jgi:hypothetical protein